MSALNPRRLAGVAVTTVLVAGLPSGLPTLLPAEAAAPSAPAPAPSWTRSSGDADGLTIENSFVRSQGRVKPGDEYPSRILLGSREDAAGQTVRTTYKKSGKRLLPLTVTDRAGNSATFTRTLRVRR